MYTTGLPDCERLGQRDLVERARLRRAGAERIDAASIVGRRRVESGERRPDRRHRDLAGVEQLERRRLADGAVDREVVDPGGGQRRRRAASTGCTISTPCRSAVIDPIAVALARRGACRSTSPGPSLQQRAVSGSAIETGRRTSPGRERRVRVPLHEHEAVGAAPPVGRRRARVAGARSASRRSARRHDHARRRVRGTSA